MGDVLTRLPTTKDRDISELLPQTATFLGGRGWAGLGGGIRCAYAPSILLNAVLLAYSQGIISSRGIERSCRDNVVFVAITDTEKPRVASTKRKPMRDAPSRCECARTIASAFVLCACKHVTLMAKTKHARFSPMRGRIRAAHSQCSRTRATSAKRWQSHHTCQPKWANANPNEQKNKSDRNDRSDQFSCCVPYVRR